MLDGMELFGMGWSWGGYESLLIPTHPATCRTAAPWSEPTGVPCASMSDWRTRTI